MIFNIDDLKKFFISCSKDNIDENEISIDDAWNNIITQYSHPSRFYHTLNHISELISTFVNTTLNPIDFQILCLTAFYHDYIYEVTSVDNELRSAMAFKRIFKNNKITRTVYLLIIDTSKRLDKTSIGTLFHNADFGALLTGDLEQVLINEKLLMKEYQYFNYQDYKKGRLNFLQSGETIFKLNDKQKRAFQGNIDYLNAYKPNIGIFAGSFNPFHKGHLNILLQAEQIFDKVIIVHAINSEKISENIYPYRYNGLKFRENVILESHLLLTDYIKTVDEYSNAVLIRGLRSGYDFNYEQNQLKFFKTFYPELKTISIFCDQQFEHISSSAIRKISVVDSQKVGQFLPESIYEKYDY